MRERERERENGRDSSIYPKLFGKKKRKIYKYILLFPIELNKIKTFIDTYKIPPNEHRTTL